MQVGIQPPQLECLSHHETSKYLPVQVLVLQVHEHGFRSHRLVNLLPLARRLHHEELVQVSYLFLRGRGLLQRFLFQLLAIFLRGLPDVLAQLSVVFVLLLADI